MQRPDKQTTTVKRPYQSPKLEPHGVWQLTTGVALSIGLAVSLPTDTKLETFEWNGEL
jgi:hypothetical protein